MEKKKKNWTLSIRRVNSFVVILLTWQTTFLSDSFYHLLALGISPRVHSTRRWWLEILRIEEKRKKKEGVDLRVTSQILFPLNEVVCKWFPDGTFLCQYQKYTDSLSNDSTSVIDVSDFRSYKEYKMYTYTSVYEYPIYVCWCVNMIS